jgi:hypothetical protein
MLYEIKSLILLKIKTAEYNLRVYRQNIAIKRAFQFKVRRQNHIIATVSIFIVPFMIITSYIFLYNQFDRIKTDMREDISNFSLLEANLAIPSISQIPDKPDIQRFTSPSDLQEEKILQEGDFKLNDFILVVDKVRKEILVMIRNGKRVMVVDRFTIILGKNQGDKAKTGDMKTPEGVYKIIAIKEEGELIPMYGPKAFVLNYPNDVDKKHGKTGAGIWIHGIGDESREPVTKGCIAMDNNSLFRFSQYAKINTNIFIFPEGFMIPLNDSSIINILNESFILELKNSMVAVNSSSSKKKL